jgi:hypothetical protein
MAQGVKQMVLTHYLSGVLGKSVHVSQLNGWLNSTYDIPEDVETALEALAEGIED